MTSTRWYAAKPTAKAGAAARLRGTGGSACGLGMFRSELDVHQTHVNPIFGRLMGLRGVSSG